MREQMEQHHANPVCATCHRIFEPIGLALENFDAIGTWRTKDDGLADRCVRRARGRDEDGRRGQPARRAGALFRTSTCGS